MCRLFGLYANKPVDVEFSFYKSPKKRFEELSYKHCHGWGIAWIEKDWQIYKEPKPLYESSSARKYINKKVCGRIIISHIRRASVGSIKKENTHPWLYKGWVFAHNGTIHDKEKILQLLNDNYKDFEGSTDSEIFFHLIIQEVNSIGDSIEGIRNAIEKIIRNGIEFTSLNFIASDGEKLYALRYAQTELLDNYTLYYIKRPMKDGLEGLSRETQQLIKLKLSRGEKAIIIASETMSDEKYWNLIQNKHLIIIDKSLNINTKTI